MAAKGILERLSEGVVLGDGGYIIELEQRGYVVTGAFTPELAITHPGGGSVRPRSNANTARPATR